MAPTPPPVPSVLSRTAAVALAVLMIVSAIPFVMAGHDGDAIPDELQNPTPSPTPPSSPPQVIDPNAAQAAGDFFVLQGEAKLYQGNWHSGREPTYFIDNGTGTVNVTIPIHNTRANPNSFTVHPTTGKGSGALKVWMWLSDPFAPVRGICYEIRNINFSENPERIDHAYWPDLVTRDLEHRAFNLTYSVNVPPPTGSRFPNDVECPDVATPEPNDGTDNTLVEANPNNNIGRLYFVKEKFLDLTVAKKEDETLGDVPDVIWCAPDATNPANCDRSLRSGEWNKTVERTPRDTWFVVHTENHGTWEDLVNLNCIPISPVGTQTNPGTQLKPNCPTSWPYDLNITLRGALTVVDNTSNPDAGSGTSGNSSVWNISDRAGPYTARIDIDPRGVLRQGDDARADVVTTSYAFVQHGGALKASPIEVKWRDYTANFSAAEFKTSASEPYSYTESFFIEGNLTVSNLGKAPTNNTNQNAFCCPVYFRYYLDNLTSANTWWRSDRDGHEQERIDLTSCPSDGSTPCTAQLIKISWEASSVLTNAKYLPPGMHKLIVEVDNTTETNPGVKEINEANNRIELPIYIRDTNKPRFLGQPRITNDRLNNIQGPPVDTLRAGENFTIHVNVTDDDFAHMTVLANLSYNATHYLHYYLQPVIGADVDRYILGAISNFTFATNATEENWTLNVTATDSFGNPENATSQRIKLLRWPLHTISPSEIFVESASDPTEMSLTDPRVTNGINITIRVLNDTTGQYAPDQPNVTRNLALRYTTPKNITKTLEGDAAWPENNTVCQSVPVTTDNPSDQLINQRSTTVCNQPGSNPELYSTRGSLDIIVNDDEGGPGTWNLTVIIKDVSGQAREFNRTVRISDAAPIIRDWTVLPAAVAPGERFNVSVNATDDVEVKAAFVNFTRSAPADGTFVNLTLYNGSTHTIAGTSELAYWWNSSFQTGRNKEFGVGGTFGVNISVKDGTDNWQTQSVGTFTLADLEPPQVDEASVSPAVQEVGQNVTFTVRARDATNVTAYLRVMQGSLVVFPPNATAESNGVKMIEDASGNFSYSLNLSREGEYTWAVDVVDSVGRNPGTRTGSLAFRDNLGPRFEMRSPSYVFEGQRYSGPLPRIEALVYDSEGVVASTVTMRVDNVTVSPDLLPAPAGANGYLVVYTIPAAKRYHHRDVVTVNFTAIDNSTRQLGGFGNFTFIVDDVPPIARLVSVEPSFRARASDPLNISLASRFTLAAEDNDGLPTEADSITLQILGGGNNGEIVYTGPFKINDAPGLYTGPRVYSVQYWASDSVGNKNATKNITTVFVDETPPALFQYLPQGRFINATFVDDRVGVSRAVVWHRVNNDPYTPISLTQDGDQWTTTLPEGKKGDRTAYYLQAWDRLNNTATYGNATSPYATFDVGNHEPTLKITSPTAGSRVSRQIDLRWNASDEDRDALVFTVSYKAPGSTTYRELTKLENSEARRYTIDSSKYPDGEYTFRVAVSDGGFSRVSEVTLTIINQASPVGPVTVPSEALPGDKILIKAQITKAQAVVEARVYLEGDLVQAYPMNDEGRDGDELANDGYYSVRVPVDAAGDYRVEIFTRYQEDGELKESSVVDAASFSAKLTPGYVLSEYAFLIAGIALLAAVGIGVAVFVIVRRK